MIMSEELLRVGDRVRHADGDGRTGIIVRFQAYPLVTVRWESTGTESSENVAYLMPVFHKVTVVKDYTVNRGTAHMVVAYMSSKREGDRVVACLWHEGTKTPGGLPEHPTGTITCERITGVGVQVEHIVPERVVSRGELPPDIAAKL
jgi:hypothetical protein